MRCSSMPLAELYVMLSKRAPSAAAGAQAPTAPPAPGPAPPLRPAPGPQPLRPELGPHRSLGDGSPRRDAGTAEATVALPGHQLASHCVVPHSRKQPLRGQGSCTEVRALCCVVCGMRVAHSVMKLRSHSKPYTLHQQKPFSNTTSGILSAMAHTWASFLAGHRANWHSNSVPAGTTGHFRNV